MCSFCIPTDILYPVKTHERDFPIIAAMAHDFFAIPGTSVSVERLFSSARQLCQDLRSCLLEGTIMEAMLTRAWLKAGLYKFR
jgi:hypothetical protein